MRLGRIVGVVLLILVISYFGIKKLDTEELIKDNPFELMADGSYLSDNVASLKENSFNESNSSNSEIIEFVNTNSYSVELEQDDITITCVGTGNTKESDEELVSKNFRLNAKFSKEKNNHLDNSLLVKPNEKVYIHVITEYNGELPQNEVKCDYNVNVTSS